MQGNVLAINVSTGVMRFIMRAFEYGSNGGASAYDASTQTLYLYVTDHTKKMYYYVTAHLPTKQAYMSPGTPLDTGTFRREARVHEQRYYDLS